MGVLRQIAPQILYASYFSRDPVGAKGCLLGKYDLHDCPGDPRETSAASRAAADGPVKTSTRPRITVRCLGLIRWNFWHGEGI